MPSTGNFHGIFCAIHHFQKLMDISVIVVPVLLIRHVDFVLYRIQKIWRSTQVVSKLILTIRTTQSMADA